MYSQKLFDEIKGKRPVDRDLKQDELAKLEVEGHIHVQEVTNAQLLGQPGEILLLTFGDARVGVPDKDFYCLNCGTKVKIHWEETVQGHLLVFIPHILVRSEFSVGATAPRIDLSHLLMILDLYPEYHVLDEDTVVLEQAPWGHGEAYVCFFSEARPLILKYISELEKIAKIDIVIG